MHAYATKDLQEWGVSRRVDGKGAFQTNVTWATPDSDTNDDDDDTAAAAAAAAAAVGGSGGGHEGGGGVEGGGWTKFYRRERPELRLDGDENPAVFYSGIEYGEDHPQKQYSFSIVQQVNGGQL